MTGTLPIPKLHREYNTWVIELNFAREEIRTFEKYLTSLSGNYYQTEVTTQVERFRNRFIRHKDVIDRLRHDLGVSEQQLVGFVKELSGMGLKSVKMDNHGSIRE